MFPSQEWITAYCALLEADPRAGAMARALQGVYRFVVEPGGSLTERHSYDVSIVPEGDGAAVTPLPTGVPEPRLVIAAVYPRWVQLLRGELDIPLAIMLRRIKVTGDLRAVTANLDDARPLLDALSAVESQTS
jgi:hypothetical protein